jgi:hypothetical protein
VLPRTYLGLFHIPRIREVSKSPHEVDKLLEVAVATIHEAIDLLSDLVGHTLGDISGPEVFSGLKATDSDLESHMLIKLIKFDMSLGPADVVLMSVAGGLGGDDDTSGGALVVTDVQADIIHRGHEFLSVDGGRVSLGGCVSRLCFSLTRSEGLEANDPSALEEILIGLSGGFDFTGEAIGILLLGEVEVPVHGSLHEGAVMGLDGIDNFLLSGRAEGFSEIVIGHVRTPRRSVSLVCVSDPH